MKTRSDDPWLSVHAISEYCFCPRAGLIAYENKRSENYDEPPSFDTLPKYEIEEIEEAIGTKTKLLIRWLIAVVVLAVLVPIAVNFEQHWYMVIAAVGMLLGSWQSINTFLILLELQKRLDAIKRAKCVEPDPYLNEYQPVNWFGLLNLDFQSQKLKEPLRDDEWNFEGAPWRILIKGDLQIPVFRTRSRQVAPRESQVTKCMAYCRLVSVSLEKECPYGIILTGDDLSGFAIPNTQTFRQGFHDCIVKLRQLIQSTRYGIETKVDFDSSKCSGCPLGEPHSVELGRHIVQFGAPVEPHTDRDGKHSDCGDRFKWHPPYRG